MTSITVLKDFADNRFSSFNNLRESKSIRAAKIEQHTKIFASMCPDEILDHYHDYETREYYTTLMLGDVSGFTDLTEKYTRSGKGGPSKLTEMLNSYIGPMVQEILSHNGDVLKFSGDAFIVMWKLQGGMVMRDLAVEAIQTACVIQKYFGTLDTDVGITLRVKLAIASGRTYFTSIGDPETRSYYIITGQPVWDVKSAEALCRGGDIIVAPSSWKWANPSEYVYETMPDGIHTLILASSFIWEQAKDKYIKEATIEEGRLVGDEEPLFSNLATDRIPKPEAASVLMNLTGDTLNQYQSRQQTDYSLRPKVNKAAKAHLMDSLKSYMLRPVVRSVEMDEPIEYLTEMRQVVIVFVNVITTNISRRRLIQLVNMAYKSICEIVDNMQGCVNKTALFDKDLMFLCIFGLRGDKHELESQIGLRCSVKIREALVVFKRIKSVSVAVTTGMTYCGVVGHILRREYTVIGMSVNKAARLMCAYPDKVICDRESFLHSRLEARHFILQETKILKGITNVGPVYEFSEQARFHRQVTMINKYPLLGRTVEMNLFRQMFSEFINARQFKQKSDIHTERNTLIIKGEPRMGKTRFLDEITQELPSIIPYNRVTLVANDNKVPYTLVRLIFHMPLGITASSTLKERRDKLVSHLGNFDHICILNEVFKVNFNITSRFSMLKDDEKHDILRILLLKLMHSSFECLWVVIIDDAEFGDEESLSLLPNIINENLAFFVLSFNHSISLKDSLHPIIFDKVQIIELVGLDKWFHVGLACQFLNVRAIPAELEKVIQEKSLGNPGWIESYLVSLMQAGGLVIRTVNHRQLRNLGLVVPSIGMLKNITYDAQSSDDVGVVFPRMDGWRMYKTSYKDSTTNVLDKPNHTKKNIENTNDDSLIPVCIIPRNFILEDMDTEISMNVMILKMFDSLSSIDQLLLKCAAVLGEPINRKMLEYLLEDISQRDIGLAVKRLFETKILACAVGDFKRSLGPIFIFRNTRDPNLEFNVICACIGIKIDETCADLPTYASCGLMRFKMSMYRDTTYGLLPENLKVDLHNKALTYLQYKTRRCAACGGGHFMMLLGNRYYQESIKDRRKRENLNYILDVAEYGENPAAALRERIYRTTSMIDINKRSMCTKIYQPIVKEPTRTFSGVDFTDCQCNLILITVYTQVLEHCRGIGRKDKALTAILEFVEVCLAECNIPQARKLLNDGEIILSQLAGMNDDDDLVLLPYLKAKIQTLRGRCYLESGLVNEASDFLYNAVKSLGYSFPKSAAIAKMKSVLLLRQQILMLRCLRQFKVGIAEGDAADYSDQLTNCLGQMFIVFRAKGLHEHARLAAIWQLNSALESNKDFFALCTAYANMVIVAHNHNYKNIIPWLEFDAINICYRKKNAVELQELKAVAELYSKVFFSRAIRGMAAKASSLGFITVKLCQTLHAVTLKLTILPRLIYLLMMECRHDEVISMLQELDFISKDDTDKSGRTWYHALNIDLQLETGLSAMPFRKCERYFQEESDTFVNLRDSEAEERYFTCMWLWCVRTDDWESATVWKSKMTDVQNVAMEPSLAACITAMKRLEGLLIYYVHKVENRNVKVIVATLAEIHNQFRLIKKYQKMVAIIRPRYMLMRAYYYMIRFCTQTAFKFLEYAKMTALSTDNKMDYEWADHCKKAWTGSISSIQRDFWKEHCINGINWHEIDMKTYKMVAYSLPLPKYPQ